MMMMIKTTTIITAEKPMWQRKTTRAEKGRGGGSDPLNAVGVPTG